MSGSHDSVRHPRLRSNSLVLVGACLALGCGGATEQVRSLPVPDDQGERRGAIDSFGEAAYSALAVGYPNRLLLDDEALRRVVQPNAATRWAGVRAATTARLAVDPAEFEVLRVSSYKGVCLQGARLEPAGSQIGLYQSAWVFDRALVVATQPGGRPIAAWIEGTFVYTNRGFHAIDLARVETPRWEHADLELATCDMEVGVHSPRDIVEATE
ncbi:MAG: hypothetical protein AAGF12_40855 [Myxococcota bacterium]